MGFLSSLGGFLNNDGYSSEVSKFKKAVEKNPTDLPLRAKYAKFCLRYYFAHPEGKAPVEAVEPFEKINYSELFDPEFYYLMGRYYQGSDDVKAARFYLDGIKCFNNYIKKNPGLKEDYKEIGLATALNLMPLQSGGMDPELDKFFKSTRKSHSIHAKHVELEGERDKADADPGRAKQLSEEISQLKHERKSKRFKANPEN